MKNLADMVVLFVDDDTENLKALNRILHGEPYKKRFAESGAKALEIIETENIVVIASDLKMPDLSGEQLIRAVKSRFPETVCILMSGANDVEHIVESLGEDMLFGFVTKPISIMALKQLINDAIPRFNSSAEKGNET